MAKYIDTNELYNNRDNKGINQRMRYNYRRK